MTTETETETLQWDMVGHQRENHSRGGGMTLADQNQPEVREPNPLFWDLNPFPGLVVGMYGRCMNAEKLRRWPMK